MKIRVIINCVVSVLSLVAIFACGWLALESWRDFRSASLTSRMLPVNNALLNASGALAAERGMTATAASADQPAGAEQLGAIAATRGTAASALQEAVHMLEAMPDVAGSANYRTLAQAETAKIAALRSRADDQLKLAKAQRDDKFVTEFAAAMTGAIRAAEDLRQQIVRETFANTPRLSPLLMIQSSAWLMSEYAGRERAALGGAISSGAPLPGARLQAAIQLQGVVDAARLVASREALRAEVGAPLRAALAEADKIYFTEFAAYRAPVYEATMAGKPYPVSAADWIKTATSAIGSLIAVQKIAGEAINAEISGHAEASRNGLMLQLFVLAISLMIGAGSLWVVRTRLVKPLQALAHCMARLARAEYDVVVPGVGRTDEVGEIAAVVEVLKQAGADNAKLRAEQEQNREEAARQRKEFVENLASQFESNVGAALDHVTRAAEEMRLSASSLTETAKSTSQRATGTAAAAQQASVNIEAVAAATEELRSTIAEVNRQIEFSTNKTREAADDVNVTRGDVAQLTESVSRIGDVVELIKAVAQQTNLLALNATIEAARSGEAGRGFAVVANEVKALAGQTANATEQIASQISSVIASSHSVSDAIDRTSRMIGEINAMATTVASAAEEQEAATAEIAQNVSHAATGASEVSTNIAAVGNEAVATGAMAVQVLNAADQLNSQASAMKIEVDNFIRQVRAA